MDRELLALLELARDEQSPPGTRLCKPKMQVLLFQEALSLLACLASNERLVLFSWRAEYCGQRHPSLLNIPHLLTAKRANLDGQRVLSCRESPTKQLF
jgi:hypothetical protein